MVRRRPSDHYIKYQAREAIVSPTWILSQFRVGSFRLFRDGVEVIFIFPLSLNVAQPGYFSRRVVFQSLGIRSATDGSRDVDIGDPGWP